MIQETPPIADNGDNVGDVVGMVPIYLSGCGSAAMVLVNHCYQRYE
jgi:Na+/H+-translocating membrane pyrophosphatase